MELAVLSGKGGTGKTFVSLNLAATADRAVYVDCDAEEPDGKLFLKPTDTQAHDVYTYLPTFDGDACIGCRKCADFCRYNALVYIIDKPLLFPEMCHSCGGCSLVCPTGAVSEEKRSVGTVEVGMSGPIKVVTGELAIGEVSAVPVIAEALNVARQDDGLTIVDCPPGSGCSVMESIFGADACILVAEPTAFGFHNFQMVHTLATILHKPVFAVVNKEVAPYAPFEAFCKQQDVPILMRIPFSEHVAALAAEGHIAVKEDERIAEAFSEMLATIRERVAR